MYWHDDCIVTYVGLKSGRGENTLEKVLLIGFAGALGAVSRYAVQSGINSLAGGPTVLGTFLVNISGAFVLGLLMALTEEGFLSDGPWRTVLAVGFLGAYTTFSTLVLDVTLKAEDGRIEAALINLSASIVVGLLAVFGGLVLGRSLA
jgi:fluoride exporter